MRRAGPSGGMHRDEVQTAEADLTWPVTNTVAPVRERDLQVWCAVLQCNEAELNQLGHLLSAGEQERAARFGTATLRQRYIVSRVVLRSILSQCAGQPPESLRFDIDPQGKPHLTGGTGIEFNLSHSADLMLLSISRGAPVGVDVERVRTMRDAQAIAQRFFSAREARWLEGMTEVDRSRAFFRLWTRKEAMLKATGDGISAGLADVEMLDTNGQLAVTSERPIGRKWELVELAPAAGFVGSCALPFGPERVQCRTWRVSGSGRSAPQ